MRTHLLATLAFAAFALAPNLATAGDHCRKGQGCYQLVETPPVYDTIHEEVLVRPARHVKRRIPAVIDEVTEEVVVRPERTIARHVPAQYAVAHERVMTHPGGKKWVTRYNAHGQLVGCWVKTGPTYATVARRVLVRAASVEHETLPAVVKHRTRKVVLQHARTEIETIPAEYGTRARHVKISNGSRHWQAIGSGGGCTGGRGLFGGNCSR